MPNSPAFKWKTKNLAEITISNVWFQICLWVLLYCIFYFPFFPVYTILFSILSISSSTFFEVCLVAFNPCLSGNKLSGRILRWINAIIGLLKCNLCFQHWDCLYFSTLILTNILGIINLANCFICDVAMIKLLRNRQKVQPLKMIPWTTSSAYSRGKIQNSNHYTIPISASTLTFLKFAFVMINMFSIGKNWSNSTPTIIIIIFCPFFSTQMFLAWNPIWT